MTVNNEKLKLSEMGKIKFNERKYICAQEGWESGVEKAPQWGTS